LKPEHLTEDKLNKVRKLREIAKERGQSTAQLALAWVLRNEGMTSALVGASSPAQIEDNVKAIENFSFTSEELKKIDKILE
jgi:L-glyceraldehyde 3-phosphate reductase